MTRKTGKPAKTAGAILLAGLLAALILAIGPIGGASAATCDTSWGNQDGDWTKPSNWSNGLPGANGPNVCITEPGTYTIHVTARAGDFNNSIASAPNLILGGASGKQTIAITGTFTDQTASGSLAVGSGTIGANGQIVLSSNDPNHVAGASICAGDPGVVNEGVIAFEPGSGGGRTMQGKVTNKGAFNVNTDTVIPGSHSCGGNNLTNAGGTVNIATGKTLDATDTFAQSSGTTNVNGALAFHGGIFTASGGSFTGNNPVLTDPLTFSPSGGTGTFVVRGSSAFGSNIGSGITVIGEGTETLNTSLGFRIETKPATNAGTIKLTSSDAGHSASLFAPDGDANALTNTGTIETQQGSGGGRTLGLGITNAPAGTIKIGGSTDGSCCSGSLKLKNEGTLTIDAGKTFSLGGAPFTQTGGTTAVNGAMTGEGNSTFTLSGGSFTGNAPVLTGKILALSTGSGAFVLHGQSSFATSIGPNITLTVEGTATENGVLGSRDTADGATNAGTIKLTSADAGHRAELYAYDSDADSLKNAGTIETLTGSGGGRTLGLGIANQATGTIKIGADTDGSCCSGSLKLANAGTLTIDANKTFSLGGAPFTQTGGTTAVNGALTGVGNSLFSVSGGTFTGNAPVLTGKQIALSAGSGTFVYHGFGDFFSSIGPNITLVVEGTATENAVLHENGGANHSTNAGTIRLTSTDAGHTAELYSADANPDSLINSGKIELQQGAGGARWLGQAITNTSTGTIAVNANTSGFFLRIANAGTLSVATGKTLSSVETLTQTAGAMAVDGALNASNPVNLQGGTLRGTGTVTASAVNNTGATVHPGNSPGLLSITGNYTQGAGGKLATEIAGGAPGGGYSRLAVSGNATLNGTLDITTNGFTPAADQTFQILTTGGTRTGTFSSKAVHGSTDYDVAYNPANVTLIAHAPPPTPPSSGSSGGSSSGSTPPPTTTPKPKKCKKGFKRKRVKGKLKCVKTKPKKKGHKR